MRCSCGCHRDAFYARSGLSRACRQRQYRGERKVTGGLARATACQEHFDWVAVGRAWEGETVGRPLTQAEKLYLCDLANQVGMNDYDTWTMLGMSSTTSRPVVIKMRRDLREGTVKVPQPDWLGRISA